MKPILWVLAALLACAAAAEEKKIVCYFGSWAVYRPGRGEIKIEDIDSTLCTHMVYTFVGLLESGDIHIIDEWADLTNPGKGGYSLFNQLRGKNPSLKTLIAIGGWNEGSEVYSKVVANPETRAIFVDKAVRFVRQYGFDGLDFDWEYPGQRGGVEADKENFVLLLKALRERFDQEGLLLTAAMGAAKSSAEKSYIIPEVAKYLHFMNLMAYDFHGAWETKTGVNAPLNAGSWEQGDETLLNVKASIDYWLEQGAPREKIVLGMPLYGRSYTLKDPSNNGIGAPVKGPGNKGPYTRESGTLGYNEICEMQENDLDWDVNFDEEQRVPYAAKDDQWVGYENARSIQEKAEYINSLGLGGAMIWSIETDDFRGICGPKYPLLKTLNHVLRGGPALPTQVKCTEAGYLRDPDNCAVFYMCVPNAQGGFQQQKLKCQKGLVFDIELKICNFPDKVDCTKSL